MQNNKLIEFIAQLFARFFSKTPWFWKVVQILTAIVALVLLGPQWIEGMQEGGIELPSTWTDAIKTIVGYALFAQAFLSQLAVPADVKKDFNIKD